MCIVSVVFFLHIADGTNCVCCLLCFIDFVEMCLIIDTCQVCLFILWMDLKLSSGDVQHRTKNIMHAQKIADKQIGRTDAEVLCLPGYDVLGSFPCVACSCTCMCGKWPNTVNIQSKMQNLWTRAGACYPFLAIIKLAHKVFWLLWRISSGDEHMMKFYIKDKKDMKPLHEMDLNLYQ